MKISEFAQKLDLKILAGGKALNKNVTGIYAGDLLSWVMAHAEQGNAWITVHTHMNTIAVAVLKELSCIILPEDIEPEPNSLKKAEEEGIAVLSAPKTTYQICVDAGKIL